MKPYIKTYLYYFDYALDDFIQCEICGKRGSDIHHILARSIRKDLQNDIINLQCLCRACHLEYGDKKQYYEFLQEIHNNFMDKNGVNK